MLHQRVSAKFSPSAAGPGWGRPPAPGFGFPPGTALKLSLKHLSRGVKNAELKAEGKRRLGFFFAPESGSGGLDAMRSVPERIRGSEGKPSAAVTEFTYGDR